MDQTAVIRCDNCGSSNIQDERVRSAFWHNDRLVVIDDVPAVVCENCGEQYLDDSTSVVLDLLRGDGFPEERAREVLRVPVFSFDDRIASQGDS